MAFVAIPILLIQLYLQFLVRADYGFTVANFATLAAVVLNFAVNALLAALGLITVGTASWRGWPASCSPPLCSPRTSTGGLSASAGRRAISRVSRLRSACVLTLAG